ncbi:MAG: selenocysteine-specific translation elongation factor [Planctomycetes bacterium]|nr:selenocysteine-specific translation elongation factor [Planctomycetota bacterium]
MSDRPQIVVGTAGHIDHGKSRLVLALTGTDPDRLPEEKARGMTIDLGFAHSRIEGCDVWFVDVPGHERFIRNMVAGATGVDIALLVVAADDSVMPQTREHAEVLSLLGVERCIVAMSKMDLVDDEWGDAVEEEVIELLDSLRIEPIHVVRTSVETGRGVDALRDVLAEAARAQKREQEGAYQWFRLPIDRAFNIAGRGTVVTGSVAHGAVKIDDELELWPAGRRVRVRDLQTHYEGAEVAAGRMRLAVNLAGVSLDEVGRGCELATPGYLEATRRMDVWVATVRMPGKILRKTIRLRLHAATSEVLAELRLREAPAELTVRGEFGQLCFSEPIVTTWGQRFILRNESGSRTLGGGRVLRPVARPWTGKRPAHLEGLQTLREGGARQRLEEVIRANEWRPCDDKLLATRAGLPRAERVAARCQQLVAEGRIETLMVASTPVYIHVSHLADVADGAAGRLKEYLAANPRLPGVPRGEWPAWTPRACPPRLRPALAEWLVANEKVALADGYVVPLGHGGAMSPEDQRLFDAILAELQAARFQPPAIKSLACASARNMKRVRELMNLAAARGKLVYIAEDIWLHRKCWDELVRLVTAAIREHSGVTVADIRTMLDSSRKYVVPIAESLDAAGITKRVGDNRVLGPKGGAAS